MSIVSDVVKLVEVDLADRSYKITIGPGLLGRASEWLAGCIDGQQVCIVTNPQVSQHYLQPLLSSLSEYVCDAVHIEDGEQYKSIDSWRQILDHLLQNKHHRTTTLIALGGGVIGDLTGFAAACYQRGVGFIQVPTTLLAQVDASVGGKTAVNHVEGKNLIGAFYQPKAVLIDTDVLGTLPAREFSAGLAEVIKYGLIMDADFFCWLEENIQEIIRRNTKALTYLIGRCCELKAQIVVEDEREQGRRAILNFGHTFAHALEKLTDYKVWLHGEAVAIGMLFACRLSELTQQLDSSLTMRLLHLLKICSLPTDSQVSLSSEQIIEAMRMDKKNDYKYITTIQLASLGEAVVCKETKALDIEFSLNKIG